MTYLERTLMATFESQERMARRRHQRWREERQKDPAVQAFRRQLAAYQRYRLRHPFSGLPPSLLWMHCLLAGIQQGGRPPKARRCTKRLGTRGSVGIGEPLERIAVPDMAGGKITAGLLRGAPHAPGKT